MMSPETAAALLELCAIVEGWPGAPAQQKMKELKLKLWRIEAKHNEAIIKELQMFAPYLLKEQV